MISYAQEIITRIQKGNDQKMDYRSKFKYLIMSEDENLAMKFIENFKKYDMNTAIIKYNNTEDINNIDMENINNIYIDPDDIRTLAETYPETAFRILYLLDNNYEEKCITDTSEKHTRFENFRQLCLNGQADQFNTSITHMIYDHDFDDWCKFLKNELDTFNKVCIMIQDLADSNIIIQDPETKHIRVAMNADNHNGLNFAFVSVPIFAEQCFSSNEGFATCMREWLRLKSLSDILA